MLELCLSDKRILKFVRRTEDLRVIMTIFGPSDPDVSDRIRAYIQLFNCFVHCSSTIRSSPGLHLARLQTADKHTS